MDDWEVPPWLMKPPYPDAHHGAGIFTYIWNLGDFVRVNVGVHIPAPWFANLGHSYYGEYSAYSDYSSHYGNHNSLNWITIRTIITISTIYQVTDDIHWNISNIIIHPMNIIWLESSCRWGPQRSRYRRQFGTSLEWWWRSTWQSTNSTWPRCFTSATVSKGGKMVGDAGEWYGFIWFLYLGKL